MSKTDIRINLDLSTDRLDVLTPFMDDVSNKQKSLTNNSQSQSIALKSNRRRSNSQSQVVSTPNLTGLNERSNNSSRDIVIPKRKQVQYFVTLVSLNDTFVTRHISIPYFPETRKLGRPSGTKVKPDVTNGFFDSRVLSRNHAIMYVDPTNSKLMLKDLGSSNGTFVNNKKLETEPVEIKLGDNICFGFNIQVGISHKQINCKVENINIMSDLVSSKDQDLLNSPIDSVEYKHYQFIQDLYNKISIQNRKSELNESSKKSVNFETALFSDINPEIEENLLGLHTRANNGIFKNSGTSSSIKLENSMNLLIDCFTKLKQQNHSLNSIETFLVNYSKKLQQINEKYLNEQMEAQYKELNDKLSQQELERDKLITDFEKFRSENFKKIKKFEEKIYTLNSEKQKLNKTINELTEKLEEQQKKDNMSSPLAPEANESSEPSTPNKKLSLNDLDDQSHLQNSSVNNSTNTEATKAESSLINDIAIESAHEDKNDTKEKVEDPLLQLLNSTKSSTLTTNRQTEDIDGISTSSGSRAHPVTDIQNRSPNGGRMLSAPTIQEIEFENLQASESELDSSERSSDSTNPTSFPTLEVDDETDLRYNQNNWAFVLITSVIMGFIIRNTFSQ